MDTLFAAWLAASAGPRSYLRPSVDDKGAGLIQSRAFAASVVCRLLTALLLFLFVIASWVLSSGAAFAATAAGTVISNTAQLQFTLSGVTTPETINSNTVMATVTPMPSDSTLQLLRYADASSASAIVTAGPTQCLSGGAFNTLPQPTFSSGNVVDATQPLALSNTDTVHAGDAVFVQITDADQDRDANAIDTTDLIVTSAIGDSETIRLRETGINTGVFVGYIQTRNAATASSGDCVLQVDRDSRITARYTDAFHPADTSSASAAVDPYGLVFDSLTGQPINGARVRLVNAGTGLPATVFGDNGTSSYPAEMTTGSAVTDSNGTVYNLPAGVFRFPLVALGQYKLEITTPSGYTFASGRSIADLQQLNSRLRVNAASFGGAFAVTTPAAVAVDVPLDPSGTQLFLTKSTTTTIAAHGDFVQYVLGVQNVSSSAAVNDVTVTDSLPVGLRYQPGSVRLNGNKISDPIISGAGRTLQFALGSLAASANIKLSYVVEVTVAAHDDKLINTAVAANATGAASNVAQATIRLRNELFTDASFIVGRIVQGSCDADSTGLKGVPGVRVYLEDGRYAVTDDEGKYHFDGVPAGSHVVQMDTVTVPDVLEPQLCDDRVRHAGRSYSQFVDLRAGALWRADFVLKPKAPPTGQVHYGMNTRIAGDIDMLHTINMQVDALPIDNAKAMVMLPDGVAYVAGSAMRDEQRIADPENMDGTLIFRLNELAAGARSNLSFKTRLTPQAAGGFIIKSVLLFDTPAQKNQRSNTVENSAMRGEMDYESASYRFSPHFDVLGTTLSAADQAQLDKLVAEWQGVKNLRIKVVGHTDKNAIPKNRQQLFADNYALSQARAASVAEYLRHALNLGAEQIETAGKGPDQPIAMGNDAASLARNRRVEISIDGLRIKQLGNVSMIAARAEAPLIDTTGAVTTTKQASAARNITTSNNQTDIDVEILAGELAMLRPAVGEVPPIPSIKVAIQHSPTHSVELRLNGAPVSALNFDGIVTKRDNSLALSRWRGVDLKDGDNQLVAIVRDADGHELQRIERNVHYSGGAVRAELVKEQSLLTADGSTHPVIALRMFDAAGEPARPGTMGSFSVETPYRSWLEVQQLQDKQLASLAPRNPQFVVDDDGLARIELAPSSDSGMAVINLRFNERQSQDLRVWLEPQARDWVLVGLAEGTAAYNKISEHAEAAAADGIEENYSDDGRVAFFAKGRIKGEFLLTLAYDSAHRTSTDKQSLLGVIDPNKYYSLYGDGSEQRFEAASQRKLYIKLERRQFMAMFGDFNTGITMAELGRYSRTLTGVKSEYAGEKFGYTAFAANTDQGYVQDELQGDGTSGLYKLSQQNIIANSDQLRIEVRDRFDTGTVVETRTLSRYLDYDIDYANGTLFFKQPVMSRDSNFNPQFIIVDYEVDSGMNDAVSAGGRAYAKFGKSEVGASFINEGAQVGDTRLASVDTRIRLSEGTQLRAEVARSESDNPARAAQADAYFTELKHVSKRLDANAYFRMQNNGFGFGQQLSTESGSRKAGLDARYRLDDTWSLRSEAQLQHTATAAQREMMTLQAARETQLTTAGAGVRHVADSNTAVGDTNAEQGFVTGSIKLFDQRVTLRGEQDVSLGDSSDVTDYPDRSLLGIDYALTRDATVFADYEHANGTDFTADMTRVGVRATPWQRAQVSSSMTQQFTENGSRTFANLGLTQGWQVNDRWALDFGVDQSKTVHGANSYNLNNQSTLASGTTNFVNTNTFATGGTTSLQTADFVALSIASLYRNELWSLTDRIEHRNGALEHRWSLSSGFYREAVKGHAFAFVTQYLNSRSIQAGNTLNALVQLSWAYRPIDSRWIVLDRIDLKHQRNNALLSNVQTSRLVNNTHVNWQLDVHTQVGLQFGSRYVISSFDNDDYRGVSGLCGADYRHDLTRVFDIGVHGTAMESFKSGVSNASLGADVGITFMKNAWVSLGYNVQGYNDKDFDDAHYLAQGPYLKFRIKFDQDTFKDLNLAGMRAQRD